MTPPSEQGHLGRTDLRLLLCLVTSTQGQILAELMPAKSVKHLSDRWKDIDPDGPDDVADRLQQLNEALRVALGEYY